MTNKHVVAICFFEEGETLKNGHSIQTLSGLWKEDGV